MGTLKASTLVEVLVAMVLIAIAVGIGSMLFMNISKQSNNILLYQAQSIIEKNEQQTVAKNSDTQMEIYHEAHLIIERNLFPLPETNAWVLVEYIATNENNTILIRHKKLQKWE